MSNVIVFPSPDGQPAEKTDHTDPCVTHMDKTNVYS